MRHASPEVNSAGQYGLKPAKRGDMRNSMRKEGQDTMSLNSVNTNVGAMIALQSLNRTNADLRATEKRISTGQRVADFTDDGAAYAVAQSVRSTIGGLTTANQQLGNVQGLLSTTQSGLNDISKTMASMRDVLVTCGRQRDRQPATQYQAQYQSLLANVKSFIQDAS